MPAIGTPLSSTAFRVMLLGAGELGKETAIELQRFGVEVIACDRYAHAPAMQVAHRSHTFSMLDADELRRVIALEKPHLIVPEIEAIATDVLVELEAIGQKIIPSARAAHLTMNRSGIRRLAAEELGLATSPYRFASDRQSYHKAVAEIGFPCVVKPIMSSSGKGQLIARDVASAEKAWHYSQSAGRSGAGEVIVEGFIDFDFEITLLTLRHVQGTTFLEPIGHHQIDGDYRESWQPQPMSTAALDTARDYALRVTNALGGYGIFGVEMFVKGDKVWFSEVSPRPHDTGMVSMISQNLSQFALHARAMLGLPIPAVRQYGPAASHAILVDGHSRQTAFAGLAGALAQADTDLRLFGKPEVAGHRRMGVALALGATLAEAREKARAVVEKVNIIL